MPLLLDLPDLPATEALGERIAGQLQAGDAVLLQGPLGVGKSALARALLRALLHDPALEVPSPSYTLVQTYDAPLGPVYHFDLWRLDGPAAVAELGWDDAREGVVLVPGDALVVELSHGDGEARQAVLQGWPDRLDLLR